MSKRMTKMEACHHLTVIREDLTREIERRKKECLDESGNTLRSITWEKERIAECEARVRAIEMAGSALTR